MKIYQHITNSRFKIITFIGGIIALFISIILTCISNPFTMILHPLDGVPNKTVSICAVIFYIITFFLLGLFVQELRNNSASTKIINKRRTVFERLLFVFVFFIFVLYTLTFVYLIIWGVLSSLKDNREFFRSTFALPEKYLFSNYVEAFSLLKYNGVGLWGMIGNTLYFTICGSLVSLFFNFSLGYIFAKYEFKGKTVFFSIILFTMVLPIMGSLAPMYRLIYELGLNDNYLYVIVNAGFNGSTLLITHAYYKGLSSDYIHAAEIDGCGHFKILFKIIFPISTPLFVALFITSVIGGWNDYMTGLLYLDKLPTLGLGLYYYRQELQWVTNEPFYFAGVFISMFPSLLIFCIFANRIMDNVVIGGLKG